jgi:hypothetical protein
MTSKRVSVGEVESAREYPCQAISSSALYKREREREGETNREREKIPHRSPLPVSVNFVQ